MRDLIAPLERWTEKEQTQAEVVVFILAALHSPEAIRKILECLGLPSGAPPIARALPEREIDELNFS